MSKAEVDVDWGSLSSLEQLLLAAGASAIRHQNNEWTPKFLHPDVFGAAAKEVTDPDTAAVYLELARWGCFEGLRNAMVRRWKAQPHPEGGHPDVLAALTTLGNLATAGAADATTKQEITELTSRIDGGLASSDDRELQIVQVSDALARFGTLAYDGFVAQQQVQTTV